LEARERQLQEMEQTASPLSDKGIIIIYCIHIIISKMFAFTDGQYSAVLYTPSYIKNTKKEWNAVVALCPKSLTSLTTVGCPN
jgi:hypothetical protein